MAERRNHREELPKRIIERAERLIDGGKDLFPARGFMAGAAIWMFLDDHQDVQAVIEESNAGIIQALLARKAEGMVFADRVDLGNNFQDSTDFVVVTSRDGLQTSARPEIQGKLVIREATPNLEFLS